MRIVSVHTMITYPAMQEIAKKFIRAKEKVLIYGKKNEPSGKCDSLSGTVFIDRARADYYSRLKMECKECDYIFLYCLPNDSKLALYLLMHPKMLKK